MYQPDQLDWKIIALLNENGRMSSAQVARRLGDVSARTVKYRIDTLIRNNIIKIRSIVNPGMVGYGVLADVFIEVEPGNVRIVAEKLAELPQISYIACATGDKDILISIRARSIEELYDFVIDVLGNIPGVRHTETHLLPLKIKSIATWMPPGVFEEDDVETSINSHRPTGEEND